MLWSPQEDFVIITHGQNLKEPHLAQWLVSIEGGSESGFQGDHLHWIDRHRLVSDLTTKKIPGAVQIIDALRHKVDVVLEPLPGIGYTIVAVTDHHVIAQEFLNHWEDSHDKTTWDHFDPRCIDVDLDTMKKSSAPCPDKK